MDKIEQYLKENWGKKPIVDIQQELNIGLYDLLSMAYKLQLQYIKTPLLSKNRRWTDEEDQFLKDNANNISINEACNLLHRSRYATYQRIKFLQLHQMIQKRNR